MIKSKHKYYLFICLYGIILLAILNGNDNLFGSRVDWLCQHTVFPDVFRQSFYETGSLVPELLFDIGGGQNIFQFTYYGFLSPGILLSYLLPFIDMTMYIIGLCIVSYLASGCLVFEFLRKHFDEKLAFVSGLIFLSLPSISYHFHHHIMFVWYMPFFLLALMGIDRCFEKKKSGLFIISVVCLILTNYMFSVGCLVFLFIYAVYRILQKEGFVWKEFIKSVFESIGLFLIPVCISAFVLLPTAYALFANSRSGGAGIELYDLLVPKASEYFYDSYSMGISAIMLVAIFGNLTSKSSKKADICLNVFSLLLLICPIITYVLNGTLYVRGKVLIAYAVLLLYNFCLFLERLKRDEINKNLSLLLSFVFVLVFMHLRPENMKCGNQLLLELLILFVLQKIMLVWKIVPIVVSLIMTIFVYNLEEIYVSETYYDELYTDEIHELMDDTEGNFYRTNILYREMDMANRVYGEKFHGASIYSSTYNGFYDDFYRTIEGNNLKYRNKFMTTGAKNEFFYHFMGTKYIIGTCDPGLNYELVKAGEHLNLYENVDAFPLAYKSEGLMTESELEKLTFPYKTEALMHETIVEDDTEVSQQNHYESCIKECDVLDSSQFIVKKDETRTYVLDESYKNKVIYLSFDIKNEGDYLNKNDITIIINGIMNKLTDYEVLYYNANTTFKYVIPMENTTTLTVEISKGKYNLENIKMYTSEKISTSYDEIGNLCVDEARSKITCQTMAKEGEYLVTSIPYEAGFSAFINGKEVNVEKLNTAFVGVALQEGENNIEIVYHAPWYKPGLVLSCIGLLLWAMKAISEKSTHMHRASSHFQGLKVNPKG